jgi:biotin carboxylase
MAAALDNVRVTGVRTNLALQVALVGDAQLAAGGVDTGFLPRFLPGFWARDSRTALAGVSGG